MDNKKLLEQAVKLTNISDQLAVINMTLENLEFARLKNDEFYFHYQINNGVLNKIINLTSQIQEDTQIISNAICPDEMESDSNE